MKPLRTVLIIGLGLLLGCSTISKSYEKMGKTFFIAVFPDTCDIYLIAQIHTYRVDSLKFPNNVAMQNLWANLNPYCRASFDSIRVKRYKKDSMDFAFRKNFNDSAPVIPYMTKCYRLIYVADTFSTWRILHMDPDYKTVLLKK